MSIRLLLLAALVFALSTTTLPLRAQDSAENAANASADTAAEIRAETEAAAKADGAIAATLRGRLKRIDSLSAVEVDVTGGVVRLQGEVASEAVSQTAAVIAENVAGVVEVDNRIELSRDLAVRLQPAYETGLKRLRELLGLLPLLGVAAVILLLFWGLARFLGSLSLIGRLAPHNPFLRDLIRQAIRGALILIGLLIALDLLQATALVGTVLGAAGLVGLAVGFAFKDLVENYIASILLSLRQPFAPNDHIVVDGHEGLVVSMNSRATVLMTPDGNHLRIPNSTVFKSVMLNYTRNPQRRFRFEVGVGVNEDLARAQQLGIEVLRGMAGVLAEPEPQALVKTLADSSVVVEFFGWVDQSKASFNKVRSEAVRLLKTRFDAAGIDMPEPTYRVLRVRPASESKQPSASEVPTQAAQADVTVENDVTGQIEAERAAGVDDLLRRDAPKE
jgi:small conductance mechanosensitive channel